MDEYSKDSVSARWAYDYELGKDEIGMCFLCRKPVTNYKLQVGYGRKEKEFRICVVFHKTGIFKGKAIGYCHQACYNKWNPVIGKCKSCGRIVRLRGLYKENSDGIFCSGCMEVRG